MQPRRHAAGAGQPGHAGVVPPGGRRDGEAGDGRRWAYTTVSHARGHGSYSLNFGGDKAPRRPVPRGGGDAGSGGAAVSLRVADGDADRAKPSCGGKGENWKLRVPLAERRYPRRRAAGSGQEVTDWGTGHCPSCAARRRGRVRRSKPAACGVEAADANAEGGIRRRPGRHRAERRKNRRRRYPITEPAPESVVEDEVGGGARLSVRGSDESWCKRDRVDASLR